MELTLESAFSTGGLVGHLSYLLLVISMVLRVMWILRVLVIASALVAIAYDLIWLKDPIGVFWETLLIVVNVGQLSLLYFKNKFARFNEIEARLVNGLFPGLSKSLQRRILNAGVWVEANVGTVLTTEDKPLGEMFYLSSGVVEVRVNQNLVGLCQSGDLLGELTVLSGDPATATAMVAQHIKFWKISRQHLTALMESHEDISHAVQASIQRSMLAKIVAGHQPLKTTS